MESLVKLFGNQYKIKLMRLFLMHKDTSFSVDEIILKTKVKKDHVKKELTWLVNSTVVKKNIKSKGTKKNISYTLNPKCVFNQELYAMIAAKGEQELPVLATRFNKAGKLDLLLASGFFMQSIESRLDILIVGQKLKKTKIEEAISLLESEIGKELTYAFFETEEFLYRAHMYDKLIRETIESPHVKVLDKGVLSKIPKMSR